MKTKYIPFMLLFAALLALTGCEKDHVIIPEFEQKNAPYTAEFNFKAKSQEFAQSSDGQNILKVVIEGTGSFSFAGNVTFIDEFDLVLATGAATHTITHTTANGDKIYATMITQIGQSSITGSTRFTGGTGRFAKIEGGASNTGPLVSSTGEGSWKEEGGNVTF